MSMFSQVYRHTVSERGSNWWKSILSRIFISQNFSARAEMCQRWCRPTCKRFIVMSHSCVSVGIMGKYLNWQHPIHRPSACPDHVSAILKTMQVIFIMFWCIWGYNFLNDLTRNYEVWRKNTFKCKLIMIGM